MMRYTVLICIAALSIFVDAAEVKKEILWKSDTPVVSISASRNNACLALVVKEDDECVLKLLNFACDKIIADKTVVKCKKISCVEFSGNDKICYIRNGNEFSIYNINDSSTQMLVDAEKAILSPDAEKILLLQKGSLSIQCLNGNKVTGKAIQRKGASPEAWLNNEEFIFSRDGCLFKSTSSGEAELMVKGDPYSPWFVGGSVSPDGKKIMAFSDDTKANVGAAARSLWLFSIGKKELRQLSSASLALWLSSDSIVMMKNGELVKANINSGGGIETLFKGNVESLAVSDGKIFISEGRLDDIGLYENSCLRIIKP